MSIDHVFEVNKVEFSFSPKAGIKNSPKEPAALVAQFALSMQILKVDGPDALLFD